MGTLILCAFNSVRDQPGIARKVSNRWVDLG
jgi:hypothetical protein